MIKLETKSGFSFEVPEARIRNNRELFDALTDYIYGEGTPRFLAMRRMPELLLGPEGAAALYEHCRDEDGVVQTDRTDEEIREILVENQLLKN